MQRLCMHERKLVIFLGSESMIAPTVSSRMKRELSDLMQPAAIRVEWQDATVDTGGGWKMITPR
jgi:hypothetical protein